MSKIRQNLDIARNSAPLEAEPLGDFRPYVVLTQLKANGPHLYAGWLEAADDEMAVILAKEHYGQDQECVNIWAIDREDLASSDGLYTPPAGTASSRTFAIFTQKRAGDIFLEAGTVEAESARQAMAAAREALPQARRAHCIWAAPKDEVISTSPDEVIWRYTDQTYRLARGYARDVKEKWKRFRDDEALSEYEKEDLKEEF